MTPSGQPRDPDRALPDRLRDRWERRGWTRPGDRVVVACSGGLDSVSLLHLVRFRLADLELHVEAAHFDHAMRPDSEEDARWVAELAEGWDVPLSRARAPSRPSGEGEARRLRYAFLDQVRRSRGARWVLTAHHADDQIETILLRIVRGTGIGGLRGIPATRSPGILRPLLSFSRIELERYAATERLDWREDPSNRSRDPRRNRLRMDLLPALEKVHPGARGAILRLGRNAAVTREALERLLDPVVDEVVAGRSDAGVDVDRQAFLARSPAVRRVLARRLAREAGGRLDEAGTEAAAEFMTSGPSGARLTLTGGLVLARDFERLRFAPPGASTDEAGGPEEDALAIPSAGKGSGEVRIGGRRVRVWWGPAADEVDRGSGEAEAEPLLDEWTEVFDPERLRFPLTVRGWRPGDRTRTRGGGRKLKKLFGELRVPRGERWRLPLLVDADGDVVWIPGLHRAPGRGIDGGPEPDSGWQVGMAGGS